MTDDAPKSADIHFLPAAEQRRDLCGDEVTPEEVMAGARERGIVDLVIVGRYPNGKRYVAGCTRDFDRAIGILYAGIVHITKNAPGA